MLIISRATRMTKRRWIRSWGRCTLNWASSTRISRVKKKSTWVISWMRMGCLQAYRIVDSRTTGLKCDCFEIISVIKELSMYSKVGMMAANMLLERRQPCCPPFYIGLGNGWTQGRRRRISARTWSTAFGTG